MINKLKEINNKILENNLENAEVLKKHQIIKKILDEDKCFFRMPIENAYAILRDLTIKEEDLQMVYMELIDDSQFISG